MDKLTVKELLTLKGGADGSGGEPGCVERPQYEANTHQRPEGSNQDDIDRMEDEFWEKWDEKWFECIGVEP